MIYGVAYYPEHWPKKRWLEDAKLMQDAGINVIRIAEFAWSMMERAEGSWDFTWIDEVIEVFAGFGIKTVLGTPTATPPKWLMDKYPEVYGVDINGRQLKFGGRRHYCFTSPIYRQYIEKIVTKMAQRYDNNENVIAWQVDNELGGDKNDRCYCNNCNDRFRAYLRNEYSNIKDLNDLWGTVTWSQMYNDFCEIDIPDVTHAIPNPSHNLEYYRFMSDMIIDFQNFQVDIIRKYTTNQKITTNAFDTFTNIDQYKLNKSLDFLSVDFYPNLTFEKPEAHKQAMSVDMFITDKEKPMWRMEQQSGMPGGTFMFPAPKQGDLARWAYQSIAHGCDGIIFFRWRTNLHGAEQHWHGILGHDGIPRRLYSQAKEMGEQLKILSPYIKNTKPISRVAIVHDYEIDWVFDIQPHINEFNHKKHLEYYYKAFYDAGIAVDFISPQADFSKYAFIVAPTHILVEEDKKERFEEYVKAGGSVLFDFRSGVRNNENTLYPMSPPGKLSDLLGIQIVEYGVIGDYENVSIITDTGRRGKCKWWYEEIETTTAKVKGGYEGDCGNNSVAITCNEYGKGRAWYLGTIPNENILKHILIDICEQSNIERQIIKRTKDVEIAYRQGDSKHIIFMINHSDAESVVLLDGHELTDIIEDKQIYDECSLKPHQVRVFSLNK